MDGATRFLFLAAVAMTTAAAQDLPWWFNQKSGSAFAKGQPGKSGADNSRGGGNTGFGGGVGNIGGGVVAGGGNGFGNGVGGGGGGGVGNTGFGGGVGNGGGGSAAGGNGFGGLGGGGGVGNTGFGGGVGNGGGGVAAGGGNGFGGVGGGGGVGNTGFGGGDGNGGGGAAAGGNGFGGLGGGGGVGNTGFGGGVGNGGGGVAAGGGNGFGGVGGGGGVGNTGFGGGDGNGGGGAAAGGNGFGGLGGGGGVGNTGFGGGVGNGGDGVAAGGGNGFGGVGGGGGVVNTGFGGGDGNGGGGAAAGGNGFGGLGGSGGNAGFGEDIVNGGSDVITDGNGAGNFGEICGGGSGTGSSVFYDTAVPASSLGNGFGSFDFGGGGGAAALTNGDGGGLGLLGEDSSATVNCLYEESTYDPCHCPDGGTSCLCVVYYQCINGTITTSGYSLLDNRLIRPKVETCPNTQVCCREPLDNDIVRTPTILEPTPPSVPVKTGCGVRRTPQSSNNDNTTQFSEFPWMSIVMQAEHFGYGSPSADVFKCGASLIHPQVALTAAHCVRQIPTSDLSVRAGEWDAQSSSEPLEAQDRKVVRVIKHPGFERETLFNDIALLILESPMKEAPNIDVSCLPDENDDYTGVRCIATGWGTRRPDLEVFQATLKKVEVPIVDSVTCQQWLRKTRVGRYFRLHESFICAGGEPGIDTCKGDGGGPLFCPSKEDPNRYIQVGIVSWGIGCGGDQIPAVYSSVSFFRKWIEDQLLVNGFENVAVPPAYVAIEERSRG